MAYGKKTGGRQKGSRNKASAAKEIALAASGLTPLEYMTRIFRDERLPLQDRFEAAKAAAPYIHPRLAAVEHTGKDGGPIETKDVSDHERARALAAFLAKTKASSA